jgi:hypothetical protein
MRRQAGGPKGSPARGSPSAPSGHVLSETAGAEKPSWANGLIRKGRHRRGKPNCSRGASRPAETTIGSNHRSRVAAFFREAGDRACESVA